MAADVAQPQRTVGRALEGHELRIDVALGQRFRRHGHRALGRDLREARAVDTVVTHSRPSGPVAKTLSRIGAPGSAAERVTVPAPSAR